MSVQYTPLTQLELEIMGGLEGFSTHLEWAGASSIEYTLNNITATAERFMLGTQQQIREAGDLRGLLTLIESFLSSSFASPAHTDCCHRHDIPEQLRDRLAAAV